MNFGSRIFCVLGHKRLPSAISSITSRWLLSCSHLTNLRLNSSATSTTEISTYQDLDRNDRSVFFGGLNAGITEEMVSDYFSKFGVVEDVRMVKTFMGYSRNYGFVCFKSPDVVEEVLSQKHSLQGKAIDVGRTKKNRVVYAGRLPSHFTEDIITNHFAQFGQVESVQFIDNSKLRGKSGFAFITFNSIEEASKAVVDENHVIDGCEVKVKIRESTDGIVEAEISESKKIKVEDLPFESTTVEKLRDYFEKFGELKAIDLLINSKTKTCAAIVVFDKTDGVQNSLEQNQHEFEGREVNIVQIPDTVKTGARERTLYLENLALQTTEGSIINYFRMYGHIAKVHLVRDRETGVSQSCGIVKFRRPRSLDSFQNISGHIIDGSHVTARRRGLKFRPKLMLDEISGFNLELSKSC